MKAPIISKEKVQLNFSDEIEEFSFKVGIAVCSLIGIWAASCLIAALVKFGPTEVVKGYITAVTGV